MKKIIFSCLCILLCLNIYVVNAASVAGHTNFQEIKIPNGSASKLISEMSDVVINAAYDKVKHRLFGWSVSSIVTDQKVTYKGDTVFSKKNNTSQYLNYIYRTESESSVTTSISASASLAGKGSGKIKGVTASLDASIRGEIGKKTYVSRSEETEIKIVVPPYKKLTICIRGEARLNNGVCKYYFLGIRMKKGEWEYIDIINEYYDYYEENIR